MVKPLKIDGSQKKFQCITIWPRLLLNTDSDNRVFRSKIWSAKIHCSDAVVFHLYLVIIV
jgi:hypothetical protein